MEPTDQRYAEHPIDVIEAFLQMAQQGDAALVIIVAIDGGSVRAPGAMMAVSKAGATAGYISGGCIDADIIHQARASIDEGKQRQIRYGEGSPYVDVPLPCGGALDILILPMVDIAGLEYARHHLRLRQRVRLADVIKRSAINFPSGFDSSTIIYEPKLRVRIAGRGVDALAMARLVHNNGIDLSLQLLDGDDVEIANSQGLSPALLKSPAALPSLEDDPWTAFVLLFHDLDWEIPLLEQAMSGPAFYIGAVGSRATQKRRRNALVATKTMPAQIERIYGPIGLVPSLRNASMLAISALSEIIAHFNGRERNTAQKTALIMLAAGASSRCGSSDKLLTPINGMPLLSHSGSVRQSWPFRRSIAVVAPDQTMRRKHFEEIGWEIAENPSAQDGQATSIQAAIAAIENDDDIENMVIMLADMPFVDRNTLGALLTTDTSTCDMVLSEHPEGTLSPPALVNRRVFPQTKTLIGDHGAKSLFRSLSATKTVKITERAGIDFDTPEDFNKVGAFIHAK